MIKNLKENFRYLEIPDVTNQIFLILLAITGLVFIEGPVRFIIPLINTILCLLIVYFVSHYEKKPHPENRERSLSRFLRFWYPGFMILICFKEIYWIMISTHNVLYDDYLIKIDRWLFGTDPAVFLSGFINPYAVEFLQIAYGFFTSCRLSMQWSFTSGTGMKS
ncbi:MAG: hypothetical protein IPL53_05750 [Ignavibacteria bacterium]|nr:hypothetical protein [Ignavibacteria bacterium]